MRLKIGSLPRFQALRSSIAMCSTSWLDFTGRSLKLSAKSVGMFNICSNSRYLSSTSLTRSSRLFLSFAGKFWSFRKDISRDGMGVNGRVKFGYIHPYLNQFVDRRFKQRISKIRNTFTKRYNGPSVRICFRYWVTLRIFGKTKYCFEVNPTWCYFLRQERKVFRVR